MNLNEYQDQRAEFSIYHRQWGQHSEKSSEWKLTYAILALCGESGELANKLKKHLRAGTAPDKLVLADELGDVLWYVAATAFELGMTLEEVAEMNLEKLRQRRLADKVTG